MLPHYQYPIPQREPLIRIIRDRSIHRGMPDRRIVRTFASLGNWQN
jgi:hypothetical protein